MRSERRSVEGGAGKGSQNKPAAERSWLGAALTALAVALPLCLAVLRGASSAQWRGDLAAVRDQAMVAVGPGGSVSTALTQALCLLPLGSRTFRASLGSALAVAVAAFLLARLTRATLRRVSVGPRLSSLLAAVGALGAALSPTWQHEATIGGGAMVAVVLALGGLNLLIEVTARDAARLTPQTGQRWLLLAAATGAALAESLPAGLALLLIAVGTAIVTRKGPPSRLIGLLWAICAVVAASLIAPLLLRQWAPRSWSDVGHALSATRLAELDVTATRIAAVTTWAQELGVVALGLAAVGGAMGLMRKGPRRATAVLLLWVVVDLLYPLSAAGPGVADPLTALRLLAVGALAALSALGVAEVVGFVWRLDVPMARAAAALMVVFHMTMVAVTSEEAGFEADRSEHFAAEEWTDQALGGLVPSAAVLVHSPELAWRLWAARITRGERPDAVVIPAPLVRTAALGATPFPAEPAVEQLMRDLALTGQSSEYALSTLADARPLYVELDPSWTHRVLSHLAVDGAWLSYAPEALGRSDRKLRGQRVLAPEGRIVKAIDTGWSRDRSTAAVATRTLAEQVTTLALFGEIDAARALLERLQAVAGEVPFVVAARLRLDHAERRRRREVDLRDLLRF